MTALISDDSKITRMMIKEILTSCGFTTFFEASNGDDAIDLYKTHTPVMVTLDLTMGTCNGIEVLKKIKEVDQDAKVIMVSSTSQDIVVKDAIKNGAGGYVVKPFTFEQVTSAVEKIMKTS